MKLVVKMNFGSYVYGTNIPTSDTDLKAVYLPEAKDILLQRVKGTKNYNTNKSSDQKNSFNDVDFEVFSVQKYSQLLLEGQTVALDMLFTPPRFYLSNEVTYPGVWNFILHNRSKFLHSGVTSFTGYCRTQANKYGIKGSRMRAVKESIEFLSDMVSEKDRSQKLKNVITLDMLKSFVEDKEFVEITNVFNKNQNKSFLFFEVVGRKFDLGLPVKDILSRLEYIWNEYGHRAKAAMDNKGIDWKALMHAVRVQHEVIELLHTGFITFPRPEKDLLLKIRKGELSYNYVAKMIESGLEELESVKGKSLLPEQPDYEFVEAFIEQVHANTIKKEY